jgi:hypothetical protein
MVNAFVIVVGLVRRAYKLWFYTNVYVYVLDIERRRGIKDNNINRSFSTTTISYLF